MSTKLADRVAKLERGVQELKQALRERLPAGPRPKPAKDAWRKSVGIFKDDPMYDDVVRFGQAYRRRQLVDLAVEADDHMWAKPHVDEALEALDRGEGSPLDEAAARIKQALAKRAMP